MGRSPTAEPRRRRAFTIIELLVSVSILSFMVLTLAQLSNQASMTWLRGESRNQHRQRARAALDFMRRELQGATLPLVTDPAKPSLQFVINPTTVPVSYQNRDSVFWQAPIATDTSSGDVAEIGYFVRWNGGTASLCRYLVNPSDTANYLIYLTPTAWVNSAQLDAIAPADKTHNYAGLFLENVIGLWVKASQSNGTLIPNFDSRLNSNALPPSVAISLAFVDSRTAPRLTSSADVIPLYDQYDTAESFVAHLPERIKSGASVATLRIALQNQ